MPRANDFKQGARRRCDRVIAQREIPLRDRRGRVLATTDDYATRDGSHLTGPSAERLTADLLHLLTTELGW